MGDRTNGTGTIYVPPNMTNEQREEAKAYIERVIEHGWGTDLTPDDAEAFERVLTQGGVVHISVSEINGGNVVDRSWQGGDGKTFGIVPPTWLAVDSYWGSYSGGWDPGLAYHRNGRWIERNTDSNGNILMTSAEAVSLTSGGGNLGQRIDRIDAFFAGPPVGYEVGPERLDLEE